jgi:hypothetical protein
MFSGHGEEWAKCRAEKEMDQKTIDVVGSTVKPSVEVG